MADTLVEEEVVDRPSDEEEEAENDADNNNNDNDEDGKDGRRDEMDVILWVGEHF